MVLFYRLSFSLVLFLISPVSLAAQAIAFKQPFVPKFGWLSYGLVLLLLLVIAFMLARKNKTGIDCKSNCHVLEKKYLGNKTIVYILDYQNQRFILADNQQALTLHALKEHYE